MKKKVIIIGAGASGMTAAIFAARQGAAVTLLEHTDRIGKKILATGNGRCNLSNLRMEEACFYSSRAELPMKVIQGFPVRRTLDFFEELGIVIKDRGGYLYPYSGQAGSVLEVLQRELKCCQVNIVTSCTVQEIRERSKGGFLLKSSCGEFRTDALIIAAGSKAAPKTGSDGSGYELARRMGHRIIKPLPALVQLRCRESFYPQLAGVRTDARVSLYHEKTLLAADQGELQLTDYGISGIPVFQVSRMAARALDEKKAVRAVIDFYPIAAKAETKAMLKQRSQRSSTLKMEDFFCGWFHQKLAAVFLKLLHIKPNRPANSLTEKELTRLTELVKEFPTEVTAVNSFEHAQTCCGGVDMEEINPNTMESKKKKGLYLIGELLDVDGICGGYNLQWAWSTGAIAGTHAGENK